MEVAMRPVLPRKASTRKRIGRALEADRAGIAVCRVIGCCVLVDFRFVLAVAVYSSFCGEYTCLRLVTKAFVIARR